MSDLAARLFTVMLSISLLFCTSSDEKTYVNIDGVAQGDGAEDAHKDTTQKDSQPAQDTRPTEVEADQQADAEEDFVCIECRENPDCEGGYCIQTSDGKCCTQQCYETCPPGWVCKIVVGFGPDVTYICVPKYFKLCDPCLIGEDCSGGYYETGALCLDFGAEGKFCGADCSSDGKCPNGHKCELLEIDQGTYYQCRPESGICECSRLASEKELTTVCYNESDLGRCEGERKCTLEGELTDCDAPVPKEEECNGKDDDCDGATDNLPPNPTCDITNEHGTCQGTLECDEGVGYCIGDEAQPEVCDGVDQDCDGDPDNGFVNTDGDDMADCVDDDDDNDTDPDDSDCAPTDPEIFHGADELCDGKDNNCDDRTDEDFDDFDQDGQADCIDDDDDGDTDPDETDCEPLNPTVNSFATEECDDVDNDCDSLTDEDLCDDGNPCTDDICQADGSCVYANNHADCDDGNPCTMGDKCNEGSCQSGGPKNCDDMNACTDDHCDPNSGDCTHAFNSNPCDDLDPCSLNDKCNNGVCVPGQTKPCPDQECKASGTGVCDSSTGECTYAPAPDGSVCTDDGNPCTQDVCSNGQCSHPPGNEGSVCTDDGNPCTTDICSAGSCMHPAGNNGVACQDDGDNCTRDVCSGGNCTHPQCECASTVDCAIEFCVDFLGGCVGIANTTGLCALCNLETNPLACIGCICIGQCL